MTKLIWVLSSFLIILHSCLFISNADEYQCPTYPDEFSELDLVGTWEAGVPGQSDTIIIRADGKYKQIIHMNVPFVEYESEWLNWWIEYSDIDVLYLHLEGMNLCAAEPGLSSCENPSRESGQWIDFCRNEVTFLDNEGVLIIYSSSEDSDQWLQNGRLILFSKTPERAWAYKYHE